MSDSFEGYKTVLTVIWVLNILLEIGFIGAALYRFRTSVAGLLLAGSYGVMVIVSIVFRLLSWGAPSLNDMDSTAGMLVFFSNSLITWVLLIVLGVGMLLIPQSIDKLSGSKT
ncbi:MAG: hypothetical protein ACOC1F_06350 [Myxococcota bacterium]